MENQTNSKSIILNYGLIFGGGSIFIALIKYASGYQYQQEWYSGLAGLILMIVAIILGIKQFKNVNNGFISFGQSLKVGLGVTMIGVAITVVYYLLFMNVIEPDFLNNTIETQKTVWIEQFGFTDEQVEQAEQRTRDYFHLSLFGGMLIINLFLGFVISAITGAIMQKKNEDTF
ncbi:uncharacterized protein DUF4199 [Tenacibaculum skagerrakense]|uniref:Uncharacterized protein DUF4199 n=1 Tax=Tenacibaculum skagerrakense TaxID=186571 RepID=A0A4V6NQK2_9FLAO|nr:DUF4199 domain-containing protein [Tenacibaculum skagerrakense]TCP25766.1 uncharacterized protein DUF4199 [Tenacibaculum skagerrakense]